MLRRQLFLVILLAGGCCKQCDPASSGGDAGCAQPSSSGHPATCGSGSDCGPHQRCVAVSSGDGCGSGTDVHCEDEDTPGLCRGDDCPSGYHCIGASAQIEGTCNAGCLTDLECGKGFTCDISYGDDLGSCHGHTPGGKGGAAGQGGSSSQGGGVGQGGALGQGGSSVPGGGHGGGACDVLPDGHCGPPAYPTAACCPLLGNLYDPANECLQPAPSGMTPVACVAVPATSACIYTTTPECFVKSDGTIVLATLGLANLVILDAYTCDSPLASTAPCADGSGGASGAGGAGHAGAGG